MSETKVTLSISSNDGENSSSTTIQTDSLSDLHRMLSLAGVTSTIEPEVEVIEQEVYKPSASNQVRNPNHKINNPRFADNSLEEDFADPALDLENVNPHYITDTYADFLTFVDHDEAVARTADEFGITGEAVERVIDDARRAKEDAKEFSEDFDDYNQVAPREEPPAPKGFKDYLSDLGAEREIKHAEKRFTVRVEWMDSSYNSQFEEEVVTAGTAKEAEQAFLSALKAKNNGNLNVIDTEVEEFVGEANELTIDAKSGAIEGPFKDNLDPESAAHYLTQYPDGVLQNDAFEEFSFIFLNEMGEWKFYHSVRKAVESWDWTADVEDIVDAYNGDERDIKRFLNGFWYEPASDFFPQVFHRDGMAMWDKVRGVEPAQKQLESEVDEAFGYRKNSYDQKALDRRYDHQAALLPVPGMYSLETLGTHEYYGKDLTDGQGAYVVMRIETGDEAKPRFTFCATAGGISEWKSGDTVLTYHDQTGKERPGVVITAFDAAEWNDPVGRAEIAKRMAQGGMDPRKKYSVRTFK